MIGYQTYLLFTLGRSQCGILLGRNTHKNWIRLVFDVVATLPRQIIYQHIFALIMTDELYFGLFALGNLKWLKMDSYFPYKTRAKRVPLAWRTGDTVFFLSLPFFEKIGQANQKTHENLEWRRDDWKVMLLNCVGYVKLLILVDDVWNQIVVADCTKSCR